MKKINKKKIISIALIFLIFTICTSNIVIGISNPDSYDPRGKGGSSGEFLNRVSGVLGTIRVIAIIVSVGVLMVIGIKYLFGSIEQKADLKKTMMPYLIGSFMVIAIISILEIIETAAENFG